MIRSPRALGIFQILLSGFCFGFLGLLGKSAYAKSVTPAELLSLRFFTAGTLVLLTLRIFRRERLRFTKAHLRAAIALGVLGYAVFSFCYFSALSGLSVSLTVLLLYTYPVLVSTGAWIFLGEKIPRERWFVLPLAMIGLVCLVWGDFYVKNAAALATGFASAVFYSAYILLSRKKLRGADPLAATGVMQLAAGLTLAAFAWRDPNRFTYVIGVAWPTILALAVICSIAAMSLFLAGLQKLKSWEASILSTAEPVTSITVAYLALDERLSSLQCLGALFVSIAFIFVSLPARKSNG